jgi:hypothetical protein
MIREIPGGEIIAEALDGVLSGLDALEAAAAEPRPSNRAT